MGIIGPAGKKCKKQKKKKKKKKKKTKKKKTPAGGYPQTFQPGFFFFRTRLEVRVRIKDQTKAF